jgi:group I intron endonuclease
MESGIYKIINIKTGKCYVGSTKNFNIRWNQHLVNLKNGNHSSVKLQRSFDKHGEESFEFHIIEYVKYEKDLIIDKENYWIAQLDSKKNGYNIADASFGDVLTNHPNRDVIIKKISATVNKNISNMSEEERRTKWALYGEANGMFGKTHSDETKEKMSIRMIGNNRRTGKKLTDERTRSKLSEIASNRTGESNGMFGKTHSDETKEKIRAGNKGKTPKNILEYYIEGKIYKGLPDASKHTGIKEATIRHRCVSKNIKYKEYYIIKKDDQ